MTDSFIKVYEDNQEKLKKKAMLILRNPEDAEDAVQKALLNMLKNESNIEALSEEEQLMYLYKSIRNASYDTYNLYKVETEKTEKLVKNTQDYSYIREDDSTYSTAMDAVYNDMVRKHLESLNELYRDVLYMNIFKGMTSNQIADELKLNNELVKKRIQRGKKKLRELCNELFDR